MTNNRARGCCSAGVPASNAG